MDMPAAASIKPEQGGCTRAAGSGSGSEWKITWPPPGDEMAAIFGQLLMGDRLSGLQIFGAVLMVAAVFATELIPLVRGDRGSERP